MKQVKEVGFIGFGEVAYTVGMGLQSAGIEAVYAFDKFANDETPAGELIRKRAAEANVLLVQSEKELAEKVNVLFSTVVAKVAVVVAQGVAPYLTKDHLYVDANSSSPMLKEDIAAVVSQTDAKFVDGAIMGTIRKFKHSVPILASGDGAEAFKAKMAPFEMDITYLGEKPGKASAIKMFRSVYTKGFVGLMFEMLEAANQYDAAELVIDGLASTWDKASFKEMVHLMISGGVIHAERRANEMNEVIKTLDDLAVPSVMSQASQQKLEWAAELDFKSYFGGEPPATIEDVLKGFEEKSKRKERLRKIR